MVRTVYCEVWTVYCEVRTEYLNIIRSGLLFMAAPCRRRLVAGFSSRRRWLDPVSFRVHLCWTEWHCDRTVSLYFSTRLLVSVTRRANEQAWEPPQEQCFHVNRENWTEKYCHLVFVCFVWISGQTAIISLHNINWLVILTCSLRGMNWVYIICVAFSLRKLNTGSSQLSEACRHKLLQNWLPVYVL